MNKQTKKLVISSAILVGLLVGQTHAAFKPQPIGPPIIIRDGEYKPQPIDPPIVKRGKRGGEYKPQPIKSPIVKKEPKYKPL